MISRMIEGIRYADFSLSFSTQHKTRTEQRLAQEINNVVAEFRTRLSENEERYQYYETLLNTVDSSLLVVDSLLQYTLDEPGRHAGFVRLLYSFSQGIGSVKF